jgi:putative pyruvate formate lyase activating enzyme
MLTRPSLGPLENYASCTLCPRLCNVNRLVGERGYCGETAELRVASASIHRGEEPPITGKGGSGTIFISGCNLRCSFCQNQQISRSSMGKVISSSSFATICLGLQNAGVENINIVTGSHALPALILGIREAKNKGLHIPILWNSSAYESLGTVELGSEYLDVYLPDLKTLDPHLAARLFNAPDYGTTATEAILRMMELKPPRYGPCRTSGCTSEENETPILLSGTVLRHLVLPGHLDATRDVLRWFSEHGRGRALLSLMTQYTPIFPESEPVRKSSMPDRPMNQEEYDTVLAWLEEFDIDDGFYQELSEGDEWLPDFNRTNPFSSELSIPLWHWKTGFLETGRVKTGG